MVLGLNLQNFVNTISKCTYEIYIITGHIKDMREARCQMLRKLRISVTDRPTHSTLAGDQITCG